MRSNKSLTTYFLNYIDGSFDTCPIRDKAMIVLRTAATFFNKFAVRMVSMDGIYKAFF